MKMELHHYHHYDKEVTEMLHKILFNQNTIMANIAELTEKVDLLQTTLDAEQTEIKAAIEKLNTTIEELKALVSDGGTEEQRQALADKLDAIKTDLEGTVVPDIETPGDEPAIDTPGQ